MTTYRGGRVTGGLDADLVHRLEALGQELDATLFMTLLAAFKAVLARLAGTTDVVVGTPIESRGQVALENLIGLFLNILVLRTDLSGRPSFRELVGRVRESALGAYAHQDVPFVKLLSELRPTGSRTPWFRVSFNMLELPAASAPPGLASTSEDPPTLEALPPALTFAKHDLTVYARRTADGVRLDLVYNADLFDESRMLGFLAEYRRFIVWAVASPDS